MLLYLLKLIIGLMMTILIETAIAYLIGFRKKTEIKAVAIVSIITYPILNMILLFYRTFFNASLLQIITIFMEFIVVAVEYLLLKYALGKKYPWWRLPFLSFVMNLGSYLFGLFVLSNIFSRLFL